jgi:hypothetical protein
LGVGPDSCSFFTTYILHDFVLDVTENVVSHLVFGFTDICADFDEEGVFLLMSERERCGTREDIPARLPKSTSRISCQHHRSAFRGARS